MAGSKPIPDDLESEENSLIICSICLDEMKSPKALPCLHSFCLECLQKVGHPPGRFTCPLCQEDIPLPPDGVEGFRDNFLINQLKERKAIYRIGDIKKACACCKSSDREILAQCMDCNGFLCQQCVIMHQSLEPLRPHTIFTIEELRSGKIDPSKLTREERCQKHKDQVLRWFCKTCGIPICRDCTVMEHRHPDHDYDTIDSVTEDQLAEIKKLRVNCKGLSNTIDEAIKDTQQVKDNLAKSADEAKRQLDEEKKGYLVALEKNYKAKLDELTEIQTKKNEKIDNDTKSLQNLQSKVNNAMKIADQVISTGSKHDIVSNYSNLCKTLTQLQDVCLKPTGVKKSLGDVKFRPSQKGRVAPVNLGTITNSKEDRNGKWVLQKDDIGKGRVKNGIDISINPNTQDITISSWSNNSILVFDSEGNYKREIQGNFYQPHGVVLCPNEFHFITDRTAYVKVFTPDGTYHTQFCARSPDGKPSDADGSELYGLAIDLDGHLLVGSNNKNYISKHKQDGTHVSTIKTGINPCCPSMANGTK